MRNLVLLPAMFWVAACVTPVPESNPAVQRGVGFGDREAYAAERQARDAELAGPGELEVEARAIATETLTALEMTRVDPMTGERGRPAEGEIIDLDNPLISDEQDFAAVSTRETIESDAERIARNSAAMEPVAPEALPERPRDAAPNVVAFALNTSNARGESVYDRGGLFSESRFARACAKYATPDMAQAAFLAAGGPERDRQGVDPDGDGFACYWDPAPFRAARGG